MCVSWGGMGKCAKKFIWKITLRVKKSYKQSNVNQAGLDYREISNGWLRNLNLNHIDSPKEHWHEKSDINEPFKRMSSQKSTELITVERY